MCQGVDYTVNRFKLLKNASFHSFLVFRVSLVEI